MCNHTHPIPQLNTHTHTHTHTHSPFTLVYIYLFPNVVKSFLDVSEYLLSYPGVSAVFSERFNQDPLECFFGKQRSFGGRCDNPTVKDFIYNTTSLRLQGALAKDPVRGNCRRSREQVDDSGPLPKRARRKL